MEFTPYKQIPHLLGPVITDGEEANRALKVIVAMMDKRYELFAMAGVRNIAGYNTYIENHPEDGLEKLPWIVVIIDELADLMLVAAKEVEASIQRITQLARAAGIHLIVATQRLVSMLSLVSLRPIFHRVSLLRYLALWIHERYWTRWVQKSS